MTLPTPRPTTDVRRSVERRSGPLLVVLSGLPRLLVPLISLALLIGCLSLPAGYGAACLAVLGLLVGWLSYLSWPVVHAQARLVRLATLALVLLALGSRLLV